jgi:hypothetical protein
LIQHSDRLANPLDPATKIHKKLTAVRNKTESDHETIALSEWRGALYFDDVMGPYLPTANIRSSLVDGAKLRKLGKAVQRGTLILEDKVRLDYQGPRDLSAMEKDSRFIDCRSVVVAGKRLMRYRPIFRCWSVVVEIQFDPSVIEREQLVSAMNDAGRLIGIGDLRPNKGGSYGRYEVSIWTK